MNKLFRLLRSMPAGIALLTAIAALSLLGTVHPRVFHSWYFLLLLLLLCLNLTCCSLLRIAGLVRSEEQFTARAAKQKNNVRLGKEELKQLEDHLLRMGCRRENFGGKQVFSKHRIGRYGSFFTHLSILLIVIVGTGVLYLPKVIDEDCLPGESIEVPMPGAGAARITAESFRITDEGGRLDYASELTVMLPDGREKNGTVRVNHPLTFGNLKIYQQSYGAAGSVTVTNLANGGSDTFTLKDLSFLSLDNRSGVWYTALYPDYLQSPSGEILPIPAGNGGAYPHPVYHIQVTDGEKREMRLVLPGETVEVGQLRCRFNEPVYYPGLRVKVTPAFLSVLLVGSFVLLTAGLYLVFFLPPVLVKLDSEGCAAGGPKPEEMLLKIRELFPDAEWEDEE